MLIEFCTRNETAKRVIKTIVPLRARQAIGTFRIHADRMAYIRRWRCSPEAERYPKLLHISLTTSCNLKCFICRSKSFKPEQMEFSNIYKLETPIRRAETIGLTGWGEVFIYPKFKEVIKYIYSLNSRENLINIATNGTLLSEEHAALLSGHLQSLRVSMNGATSRTYARMMRGGDLETTISKVKNFKQALREEDKKKVSLHFVACTRNFREIPALVSIARDLGLSSVSIGHYVVPLAKHARYSLLRVKREYNDTVNEAQVLGEQWGINVWARKFFEEGPTKINNCTAPYNECYILPNGDVDACCYAGHVKLGNVYESGFEKVWFGKKYSRLRRVRHLPACKKCSAFIPLDDYHAHFSAACLRTEEFKAIRETIERKQD